MLSMPKQANLIIDYDRLRQWRDVCEFLNTQWYKCADVEDLDRELKHCNVCQPNGRVHRAQLWDNWGLQIIRYGDHPILYHQNNRSNRRIFRKWRGWQLIRDWEKKIDFLEKIVLFNANPEDHFYWAELKTRQEEWLEQNLSRNKGMTTPINLKMERISRNLCPWCGGEIIPLMLDCVSCGRAYEIN